MITAKIVSSFASWPGQDVLPWLKTGSYHEMTALAAVKALQGQNRVETVPAIRDWLTKAGTGVSQKALGTVLESLATLSRETKDREVQPFLSAYLADHRQAVRSAAARALGQLEDPRSLPALRAMASVKRDPAGTDAETSIAKIETSLAAPVRTEEAWKKVQALTEKTEELAKKLEKLESRAKAEVEADPEIKK